MKPHLDYARLTDGSTSPVLEEFLVKVHDQDSMRRAMVAFPEYFTTKKQSFPTHRSYLAKRYFALKDNSDDAFEETLSWFGIPLVVFANRTDGIANKEPSVPQRFKLERSGKYNGLKHDPWIVDLDANDGRGLRPFLILEVLKTRERGRPIFFLWAVAKAYIDDIEPTED